jgi:hypothetical protein
VNHHALLDTVTIVVGSRLVGGHTFFADSVESPPIGDVVAESEATLDRIDRGGVRKIPVSTPVGDLTFGYQVWQWIGPDAPTIVYHHGNNEDPFDTGRFATHTFGTIFHGHGDAVPANVVAVRAPYHTLSTREFARRMGDLANFTSMLGGSVAGVDALIRKIDRAWGSRVVVAGFSLGGWVTNLHRAYHGTAGAYAPMFAGAALDDLFVGSAYRRMAGAVAREAPDTMRKVLNFEDAVADAPESSVRGLLGRYDRIVRLEPQRRCYDDDELAIAPKGHVTGSLAGDRLRRHVVDAIGIG